MAETSIESLLESLGKIGSIAAGAYSIFGDNTQTTSTSTRANTQLTAADLQNQMLDPAAMQGLGRQLISGISGELARPPGYASPNQFANNRSQLIREIRARMGGGTQSGLNLGGAQGGALNLTSGTNGVTQGVGTNSFVAPQQNTTSTTSSSNFLPVLGGGLGLATTLAGLAKLGQSGISSGSTGTSSPTAGTVPNLLSGIDQKIGGTPTGLPPIPSADLGSILGIAENPFAGLPSNFDFGSQGLDMGMFDFDGGSAPFESAYSGLDFEGPAGIGNIVADSNLDLSGLENAPGIEGLGGLGGLGSLLGVAGPIASFASGNFSPSAGIGLTAGLAKIGSSLAGVGSALGGALGSIASVLGPVGLLVGFGTMMANIFKDKPTRSEMAREAIRDNLQPIFGKHGLVKPNKNWELAGEAGVPMTETTRPYVGAAAVAGELIGGEKDNGRAMNMLWNSVLSLNASPDQIKGILKDVTGSFEGGFSKWSREFLDGTLEGRRASNLAFWLGTPNMATGKNQWDFSEDDYRSLYQEGVEGLARVYDIDPATLKPVIDRMMIERDNRLSQKAEEYNHPDTPEELRAEDIRIRAEEAKRMEEERLRVQRMEEAPWEYPTH